jgi:hypothetical protein
MSNRFLVNPGTPQAWEIPLRPGVNRLGRGEDNDFVISHQSVSTRHCEVTVEERGVFLRDLGSTNGSFVDRVPVQEIWLRPGQHVQFGSVDMTFEVAGAAASAPPPTPPIPVPVPVPGSARPPAFQPGPVAVRISHPPQPAPAEEPTEEETPPLIAPIAALPAGNNVCKSHPKTAARHLCTRCRKYFCDLCVIAREGKHFCRSCGQPCTPLQVAPLRPKTEKGFFARLPEAAIYPFKGTGLLVLIAATLIFAALDAVGGSWFFFLMKFMVIGYLYTFMQNIIHATAAEEAEMPELPGFDDLFSACFRFIGVVLLCYGPPIAMLIANIFDANIPMSVIIATGVIGCLYFPMAFLAVAMKDNVMAANPLVVLPAIFKVPVEYIVVAILITVVFGIRQVGDLVAGGMGNVSLSTRKMDTLFMAFGVRALLAFVNMYLLTVNMRILGLLYVTKKHKFGWFSR